MTYQLILQWLGSPLKGYESLIEIEELLLDALPPGSDVDGHDVGTDQSNIFIWTEEPYETFKEAARVAGTHAAWPGVRAAFRDEAAEDYTAIWPPDLSTFEVD